MSLARSFKILVMLGAVLVLALVFAFRTVSTTSLPQERATVLASAGKGVGDNVAAGGNAGRTVEEWSRPDEVLNGLVYPVESRTIRSEIPSAFVYPLESQIVRAEIATGLIYPVENHTIRGEIPSEFIYPLDSHDLGDEIPTRLTYPFEHRTIRDEIPSEFIYPIEP